MIKGLEALKHLYLRSSDYTNAICVMDYETIQKELTALEIIRNKKVNCDALYYSKSLEKYNRNTVTDLTQEEYDLLKEVLL